MKILSVRNVVASLILAVSTSASAAPVTLTIDNVFTLSNNNGDLSPPIATSATASFDLSNYSVSGYTDFIDFNSYRDVTVLNFAFAAIQMSNLNAVPDFNPPPEDPEFFNPPSSLVRFYTESERVNGAAARFTRAYLDFEYRLDVSFNSGFGYASYHAILMNYNPNPNDGDPAQFLASATLNPLSIIGSSSFDFSFFNNVLGDYEVNSYFGTAQLQASNEVPEPASLLLLISGLLGALLFGRGTGRSTSVATA